MSSMRHFQGGQTFNAPFAISEAFLRVTLCWPVAIARLYLYSAGPAVYESKQQSSTTSCL